MVETAPAVTIDAGKNIVEPIVVQEARDPNLCHWSEYYFLSLLSHTFLTGEQLPVLTGHATVNGADVTCHLVQKDDMENVPYQDRTLARVKLGQPTALILDGPLADFIVIPMGNRNFTMGRVFGEGTDQIGRLHNQIWGEVQNNEYLHAAYLRIQEARKTAQQEDPRVASYEDLYQYLKKKLLERAGVQTKEAA